MSQSQFRLAERRAPSGSYFSTSTSAKVAEIFLTAGTAFRKLGELTLELNSSVENQEETKWTDQEVFLLQQSVERFASDLSRLTEQMKSRTVNQIRLDTKRRSLAEGSALPSQKRRYTSRVQAAPIEFEEENGLPARRQQAGNPANARTQYANLPGGFRTIVVRDAPASVASSSAISTPANVGYVERETNQVQSVGVSPPFVHYRPTMGEAGVVSKAMLLARNLISEASTDAVVSVNLEPPIVRDDDDDEAMRAEEQVLQEMEGYFNEEPGFFSTSA